MMPAALTLLERGSMTRELFLLDTFTGMPDPGIPRRDRCRCANAGYLGESRPAGGREHVVPRGTWRG